MGFHPLWTTSKCHKSASLEYTGPACCCSQKWLDLQQRQQEQTHASGSVAAACHRSTKLTVGGGTAVYRHAFLPTAPAVALLTLPQRVGNKCWQPLKTAATTAKGIMLKFDIAVRLLHHWRWLWAEAASTPILAQADRSRQTEIQGQYSWSGISHTSHVKPHVGKKFKTHTAFCFQQKLHKKNFQNHHLYFSMAQLPSCDKSNFLSELSSVNIHLPFFYARPAYHQKVQEFIVWTSQTGKQGCDEFSSHFLITYVHLYRKEIISLVLKFVQNK